jgi:hypothetical protein
MTPTVVVADTVPDLAVTVIVRALALLPADSVAVTTPVVLVVEPEAMICAPGAVIDTGALATATLLASTAVTVMVALVEPSASTPLVFELTYSVATVGVGVVQVVPVHVFVGVVSVLVPPPQPAKRIAAAVNAPKYLKIFILPPESLPPTPRTGRQ